MYTLLLLLIYLAFISLGLPDSLLGAGWPVMHTALQVPVSYMGLISMVISGGTIVSSLLSDRLTHKLGTNRVTATSVFLTAIALGGFSISSQFWMLVVFAVPYGLGAGAIDAALNNYVALHYSSKHMSWLHCFWGVGTVISPFVMSYALTTGSWQLGYRLIALIQLGIALLLVFTLPLWRVNQDPAKPTPTTKSLGLIAVLKIKGVPFLLMGFFAYCAVEATTMYWASTYLVAVKGVTSAQAAAFAALFYIGMTVGRFLGGFIMDGLGDHKMILLGTAILLIGIGCLLMPIASDQLALVGFVVIGLGCAPIYPCIIHATPSNFGAEHSGAIIGIQMASAYVGTTLVPPLFGLLGKWISYSILPVYLILFVGLMIFMIEKTFSIAQKA
ncbi:MFS transporter [Lactiplantibacillus mudanjiangensis]|uniref:MFS transporter [Lactobacillus amylovorus DSM] n=1 Tax=Lactiplantibacillus mudanjiangensis TaxID=1296538 RepID=A0A660E5D7_9LACO|nr:MFS transporter [Lactiplantibacillus mudanjiangensis]VDG17846.1 MFS transporter [Lactobacillus amylovorus DSM] [Lactiplantibacillus mudanjiangensis]VDG23291.1 MFS transporter [Lactobacillus amylovorus DSM] [Lactiplantibacillus mudanjiangensis]VDG28252.1 MFS transporter [Lactobacillus amylovorus DSM] [Lactiplantibacillus mudanjiangensis]